MQFRRQIQLTERNNSPQDYPALHHLSFSVREMVSYSYGTEAQPLDQHEILVLNKTAANNITDLFPTNWHPKPSLSNVQEKHFQIFTEVMTEMFLQCGLLIETGIIEMDHYQDFLKALHHHTIVGNVSTTQLTHFIMLMVYMPFCRLKYYTEHMED